MCDHKPVALTGLLIRPIKATIAKILVADVPPITEWAVVCVYTEEVLRVEVRLIGYAA
jgi:hypothetical protein